MANSAEILIAYENTNTGAISSTAVFGTPSEWKLKAPFQYPGNDVGVSVSVDGGGYANKTLRYGYGSFSSLCSHGWSGVWGRLCIIGTTAPFYGSYAHSYADTCPLSNQSWNSKFCSASTRFAIYARAPIP